MARRDRRTNDRPEYVRVLPYEIEWLSDTTATVTATCFNGEVRHKSLPISGAIALCDLLALKRVDEFPPPGDPQRMRFEFELQSPHGTKPGNVELVRRDDSWMVDWTGYDADVRLPAFWPPFGRVVVACLLGQGDDLLRRRPAKGRDLLEGAAVWRHNGILPLLFGATHFLP